MSLPSISVVIPSFGRLERLAPLVENYLAQGADQVVVVLDGPHAGWRDALDSTRADERVHIVELPENRGLALARIVGLDESWGDVVVMADDDVEPEAGHLARHRAFHADRVDHVLLGYMPVELRARTTADDAPSRVYAADYAAQSLAWREQHSDTILGSLWGGNVSLRRELYRRAEEVKPSIRLEYNEDLDLGLRLLAVGAVGVFDDAARARHHHARSLSEFRAECVIRGGALAALEERWGRVPRQLEPLIRIPPGYNALAAAIQRRIAARESPGLDEAGIVALYRVAGVMRAWRFQDALTRLLRRPLVMRGYRLASGR